MFSHSSGIAFKGTTKILTLKEEVSRAMFDAGVTHIGFCGNADVWGNIVSYLSLPEGKPPKIRDVELLMLNEQGMYHGTNLSNWLKIEESYFAIGSGMHLAIAAMESGKTPIEACRVAGKYDPSTGLGYRSYEL